MFRYCGACTFEKIRISSGKYLEMAITFLSLISSDDETPDQKEQLLKKDCSNVGWKAFEELRGRTMLENLR
jgi:hypothetical protein